MVLLEFPDIKNVLIRDRVVESGPTAARVSPNLCLMRVVMKEFAQKVTQILIRVAMKALLRRRVNGLQKTLSTAPCLCAQGRIILLPLLRTLGPYLCTKGPC